MKVYINIDYSAQHNVVIYSVAISLQVFFSCVGLPDLLREIRADYSSKPISSLCTMKTPSSPIEFMCFELATPLRSILEKYNFMSNKHHSDLFQQIWKFRLQETLRAKLPLTFHEVVTEIWDPVFLECCQLVDSVKKGNIKLKKVDYYFESLNDSGTVSHHLRNLYIAVEACRGEKASFDWITGSVDLMEQYWALCKQAKAAKIVLDLKDKLQLTGDFKVIEDVASRVDTSMMDAPLESIGRKNFKEAKTFLDKFSAEEKKLECLKQFAACFNIVLWIRKETKGQSQFSESYCEIEKF